MMFLSTGAESWGSMLLSGGVFQRKKKMWVSESCKRNHGPRPYITWLNQHLCGCQKLPKIGRRVSSKRTKSPTLKRSNPTSCEFKEAKLSCQIFFKNLKFPTMGVQGAPHKTVAGSWKKNLPHFCKEPMIWLHLFECLALGFYRLINIHWLQTASSRTERRKLRPLHLLIHVEEVIPLAKRRSLGPRGDRFGGLLHSWCFFFKPTWCSQK